MSVINKMLRDLDSRQAAGANPSQIRESRTGITVGTSILNASVPTGRKRSALSIPVLVVAAVMGAGGAAGAWWYLNQAQRLPTLALATAAPVMDSRVAPQAAAKLAPVMAAPASAAQKETAVISPMAVAKAPAMAASSAAQADISRKGDDPYKVQPLHAVPSKPAVTDTQRHVSAPPQDERIASVSAPPATAAVLPSLPRRLPALDALAQAQSLWNAGSHEPAMELVREAMAVVERTAIAGPSSSGSNTILASLARELARMELAEGQVSRVLDMLTQRESALSDFADIWALRGNAAQRLGRHEESVAAYLMALKLRPNETRWMLGAAVSLAVQGKISSAEEMTEKARAGGALSREVVAYLRQLGVSVRER